MVAAIFLLGGASRAEVLAQPIIRALSFAVLIILVLGADLDWRRHRFVTAMLAACVVLPLVQLIPLPPAIWTVLPGRAPFLAAGVLAGPGQPWRPLSLVPDGTLNALFSLVVPIAYFAAWLALPPARREWALPAFLAGIAVSATVALFQLADASFDSPLINETPGTASGLLANRNHQAVLLAIGILLIPAWLNGLRKRSPGLLLGAGLLAIWFALMILGAGSRAGLAFGAAAVLAAAWPARALFAREGTRPARRFGLVAAAITAGATLLIAYGALSAQGRAVQRLFLEDDVADLRLRALPTVWSMVQEYFPFGSGLGGFDPLFRMHEPLHLLKPTFFNHAHDDVLEVVLETGVLGAALMLAAAAWWVARARDVWHCRRQPGAGWAALIAILFMVVASALDYPLRTPLFMTLMVQAALWLSDPLPGDPTRDRGSLRSSL